MAKLADSCAGDAFARWTDRVSAYGLIADADAAAAASTTVVPLTLSLIDAGQIPMARLIEFRRRERSERRGSDYTVLRHRYADAVNAHIANIKEVESENQRRELRRQFEDCMRQDFRDLGDALGVARLEAITAPAVVSAVVAGGAWVSSQDPIAAAVAAIASGAAAEVVRKAVDLVRFGAGYSAKQREVMRSHPMAYLYQLQRMR